MLRGALRAAVVVVLLTSCTADAGETTVQIDGGSTRVALLGDAVVAAQPGTTVTIRHATQPVAGSDAPVTHALVAAGGAAPPPLFERGPGGITPNSAVWGPCRGGDVADAVGQCPVPAVDGPEVWDGTTYWSLGAMLPGEERELPLSDDLPDGDHVLVCALHPQLRVVVRVGGAAPSAGARDAAAEVAVAVQSATRGPIGGPGVVRAGTAIGEPPAYVAAFSPDRVLLTVGDSVTWRAGDRAPVDVVFGADRDELSLSHSAPQDGLPGGDAEGWDGRGELRSGFLSADSSAGASAAEWTVTFTQPGTFSYASRFSAEMKGTVVVKERTR